MNSIHPLNIFLKLNHPHSQSIISANFQYQSSTASWHAHRVPWTSSCSWQNWESTRRSCTAPQPLAQSCHCHRALHVHPVWGWLPGSCRPGHAATHLVPPSTARIQTQCHSPSATACRLVSLCWTLLGWIVYIKQFTNHRLFQQFCSQGFLFPWIHRESGWVFVTRGQFENQRIFRSLCLRRWRLIYQSCGLLCQSMFRFPLDDFWHLIAIYLCYPNMNIVFQSLVCQTSFWYL